MQTHRDAEKLGTLGILFQGLQRAAKRRGDHPSDQRDQGAAGDHDEVVEMVGLGQVERQAGEGEHRALQAAQAVVPAEEAGVGHEQMQQFGERECQDREVHALAAPQRHRSDGAGQGATDEARKQQRRHEGKPSCCVNTAAA